MLDCQVSDRSLQRHTSDRFPNPWSLLNFPVVAMREDDLFVFPKLLVSKFLRRLRLPSVPSLSDYVFHVVFRLKTAFLGGLDDGVKCRRHVGSVDGLRSSKILPPQDDVAK